MCWNWFLFDLVTLTCTYTWIASWTGFDYGQISIETVTYSFVQCFDNVFILVSVPSVKASLVVIAGSLKEDGKTVSHTTVDVYELHFGVVTWSHQGKPAPVAWTRAGKAVSGHSIYVAGGISYGNDTWKYHKYAAQYNLALHTWTLLPVFSHKHLPRQT